MSFAILLFFNKVVDIRIVWVFFLQVIYVEKATIILEMIIKSRDFYDNLFKLHSQVAKCGK